MELLEKLLKASQSVTEEEVEYWLGEFEYMKPEQQERLIKILTDEQLALYEAYTNK